MAILITTNNITVRNTLVRNNVIHIMDEFNNIQSRSM